MNEGVKFNEEINWEKLEERAKNILQHIGTGELCNDIFLVIM